MAFDITFPLIENQGPKRFSEVSVSTYMWQWIPSPGSLSPEQVWTFQRGGIQLNLFFLSFVSLVSMDLDLL